ncbi:multiheme c-type cytochrome [Candidatus Hydrogenedentota bacterium]
MRRIVRFVMLSAVMVLVVALSGTAFAGYTLKELSEESKECAECHMQENPAIYQQWGSSMHFRGNVGCYECHKAEEGDPDAMDHLGSTISIIVTPRDCARCHEKAVEEFSQSRHAHAGKIIGSLDNVLAEVVEGNNGFVTDGFPNGVSAAAVSGCWQCHGSIVKTLEDGALDPATWPNTGIGRTNPDGSKGSCSACHSRHTFSVEQARNPENCGKCHMGPDHPHLEIYNESKHGVAFRANVDKMNMDNAKWVVGEDYTAAPTCATCHMGATPNQASTHNTDLRISWNNRPPVSIRSEVSDADLGLPGANLAWDTRRDSMKDVCMNCHNETYTDNFYMQYDNLVTLYNEKFAKPGKALMKAAAPLLKSPKFSNEIDWTWFELWHHEGRRARHGAAMMGPDYTHWHGTYEVAKAFYAHLVPQIEALVKEGLESEDAALNKAAKKLRDTLDEILNSENHRWYLNKIDPMEAAVRAKRQEEFKARYKE